MLMLPRLTDVLRPLCTVHAVWGGLWLLWQAGPAAAEEPVGNLRVAEAATQGPLAWAVALACCGAVLLRLAAGPRGQGQHVALAALCLAWAAVELLRAWPLQVVVPWVQTAGRYLSLPWLQGAAWVPPLALLLLALRAVHQQVRALQAAAASSVDIEPRLRDATAEIERHFRQWAELRVEEVTEKERKRIAADLHDDLGAKLLTIVHTSEDPRIASLAREALEEMRLSVRGLTGKPVPLANALGDWRAELMSRLLQSGIEAQWDSPDDLPQTLSARAYVQTTRILREATSNIIKHSGATRCSFTGSIADGDLQLVIQDNGAGIPLELDGRLDRGHGMMSMKQRAKQMQGQCLVESGPGYGTVIRLTLPLDRATQGPAPAHLR